ncbi:hypothetical protein Scep_024063 [Stephania cephalantha]|uniref:Uncharacterized protein n=1 Tax=Stephania cephalantha TaxID=152367 RepID=A0AAP0HTC7_9MAGN
MQGSYLNHVHGDPTLRKHQKSRSKLVGSTRRNIAQGTVWEGKTQSWREEKQENNQLWGSGVVEPLVGHRGQSQRSR